MSARAILVAPDGALRAPWRIVVFLLVAVVCVVVARIAALPLLALALGPLGIPFDSTVWSLLIGMAAAHWIVLRWLERGRQWSFVALDREAARPRTLAVGFLLGALAIGLPTLALLGANWLAEAPGAPGSWGAAALRLSWFLLPAALWEELFSRGYVFSVMRESLGWRVALVATSIAFGVLHLANPGADARSATLVAIAGIFLGAVLVAFRSLYAAWMAHFAWNWTMAVVFHTAVSGFPMEAPNYRIVDNGPDWATGGAWGPEGGVPAMLGMGAGLIYLFARRGRREES